ncbi:MAG: TIM barrel protein [Luteitalea sp.]|nr:TIM barrel protein [Luteitalea sp.]
MTITRRTFLSTASALALGTAAGAQASPGAQTTRRRGRVKLGVSSYSYWHFDGPRVPIETVIDKAAALGFEGVDVLHRQMESDDRAYLQRLKRHAFLNGIDLIALSIHQGFVDPDPAVRKKHIDHTIHCLEMSHSLGMPCMRLNTGRWGTIQSFDDLMEARGIEPVLPGHTEDEGFKWCIDSIEQCLPKAEELGVLLALENHWGLARTPDGLLRIVNAVDSPWLGVLMDTGNFLEDPYSKLEEIAPKTVFVQAKTYYGGGEWYTLDLDYRRIAKILEGVNYSGYVSLEFEGKEAADTGVPKSLEVLRQAFTG